jgi:hypothetical protein
LAQALLSGTFVIKESCAEIGSMRRLTCILFLAAAGAWAMAHGGLVVAQAPAPNPQPKGPNATAKNIPTVSIGFRNEFKSAIIIQGHSIVNGMQRRGQPLFINAGKIAFDNNVPAGVRFITILDATQPSRVLLLNFQIPVPAGRDQQLLVRPAPNNPNRIVLMPDTAP